MISPCKEIWQSWILNSVPWILHSGFFVSGTWILDSNYKWDPEYLTFISDSKRKITQIPDSLRWGDSDPKINAFSVKPKPVNWASNYCNSRFPLLFLARIPSITSQKIAKSLILPNLLWTLNTYRKWSIKRRGTYFIFHVKGVVLIWKRYLFESGACLNDGRNTERNVERSQSCARKRTNVYTPWTVI